MKETLLNKRLDNTFFQKCATAFHKQVLESWTEIYCSKSFSFIYNKYITIAKRTISVERFPNNLGHNVKIFDMLDNSGDLLK